MHYWWCMQIKWFSQCTPNLGQESYDDVIQILNLIGGLHLFITTGIKSKMTDNFVKVEQKRAPGPSVMSYKRLQQWDAATKTILDTIFQRDRVNGIISSWLMEVKLIRLHKYIEGIKWNWWKCWPEEKRHKRKFRSNSQQIRMLELLSCDCCVRKCLFIKLVMLSSVN